MRGDKKTAPAVLVLGARVYDTGPSPTLLNRVNAAAEYLRKHPGAVCITTGGKGADELCAEGEAAKKALEAAGIEPHRILAETRSTTTTENLRFAKAILIAHGYGTSVMISTQRYHMYRACAMARRIGLEPSPLFAKARLRSLPKNICREFFAILKFLFFSGKE